MCTFFCFVVILRITRRTLQMKDPVFCPYFIILAEKYTKAVKLTLSYLNPGACALLFIDNSSSGSIVN
jgi:hypothetical protein